MKNKNKRITPRLKTLARILMSVGFDTYKDIGHHMVGVTELLEPYTDEEIDFVIDWCLRKLGV
tara:strand:- start:59 stop:247 length:189 start_codon:yes stop_codon:yes gene_type:complete